MRQEAINRLTALLSHFERGGLPDVGERHPKAGCRWSIGRADYGAKVDKWRENLGHDLF